MTDISLLSTPLRQTGQSWKAMIGAALLGVAAFAVTAPQAQAQTLLNVSYDPTRELYRDYNAWFADWWVAQGNPRPTI
jgi:sulfate transport system substrate-binding protein